MPCFVCDGKEKIYHTHLFNVVNSCETLRSALCLKTSQLCHHKEHKHHRRAWNKIYICFRSATSDSFFLHDMALSTIGLSVMAMNCTNNVCFCGIFNNEKHESPFHFISGRCPLRILGRWPPQDVSK